MNIKVIPVRIEVNAKNPEEPLKVDYMVELSTSSYNDFIGGGSTLMSDESVAKAAEALIETITVKIESDLGISNNTETTEQSQEEEEL